MDIVRQGSRLFGVAVFLVLVVVFQLAQMAALLSQESKGASERRTTGVVSQVTIDPNTPPLSVRVGEAVEKVLPSISGKTKTTSSQYTIKRGDNLTKIAKQYCQATNKNVQEKIDLIDLNNEQITNPNIIQAGDVIVIPKECFSVQASAKDVFPEESRASQGKRFTTPPENMDRPPAIQTAPAVTHQCKLSQIAPQGIAWNERVRLLQVCLMKEQGFKREAALVKARSILVSTLPRPQVPNCKAAAPKDLNERIACIRKHYDVGIKRASLEYKLNENLLVAIMLVESSGNPHAVSPSWCLGLMQLLPSTAEHFGIKMQEVFHPEVNIAGGARVLAAYMGIAGGDLDRALASYNLGPGEVNKRLRSLQGFDPSAFDYTRKVRSYLRLVEKFKSP